VRTSIAALTCLLLCLPAGCDPSQPAGSSSPEPPESASPEACPDTEGPFVQGRVLVPRLDMPRKNAGSNDAGGLDGEVEPREVPADGVRLAVTDLADGSEVGSTTTDRKGRWCIDLGDREPGMALLAEVRVDGVDLRRPLLTRDAQIVSIRSEAVWRMLADRLEDPTDVEPATFLNLEAMVSTASDLLEPVDWRKVEDVAQAVDRTVERATQDRRVSERLEELAGGR
jgi:hypothetical protein